jgi:hypothetical protein
MPGVQISELPSTEVLSEDDAFPVQLVARNNAGGPGVTRRISAAALAAALGNMGLNGLLPNNYVSAALPAGLTSDLDPPGFSGSTNLVRLTSAGNFSLDGLVAPPGGSQFVFLMNCNTVGTMTIIDASGSVSAGANQFLTQGGASMTFFPGGGIMVWYDPVSFKWRVL